MNECYKCKYRGTVAGSCHSSCDHPDLKEDKKWLHILVVLKLGATSVGEKPNNWLVIGNSHGIKSGWFNWPVDFDPVWVERCDGYEQVDGR